MAGVECVCGRKKKGIHDGENETFMIASGHRQKLCLSLCPSDKENDFEAISCRCRRSGFCFFFSPFLCPSFLRPGIFLTYHYLVSFESRRFLFSAVYYFKTRPPAAVRCKRGVDDTTGLRDARNDTPKTMQ